MKVVFIVLAAGEGKRFGARIPKQFFKLSGKTLLYRTLKKLERASWINSLVVVLPKRFSTRDIIPAALRHKTRCVSGGKTRFKSLLRAIRLFQGNSPTLPIPDFVFVHDGCRPNWSIPMAKAMLEKLKKNPKASGVVPLVKIRETVKIFNGSLKTLPNRDKLYVSQTPQLVRYPDLMKALLQADRKDFLDEAQILEEASFRVLPFDGDSLNIKLTYPEDLEVLFALYPKPYTPMLIGLGFDLHKLKSSSPGLLLLGGVKISAPFKVLAHSDGDILLHTLSDAILSALGLPDIGVIFPPGDKSTKGMDSREILKRALTELKKRKKKLINVSCVVVLEKPRLADYRDNIKHSLAQLLGIPKDCVGFSAKSFEGIAPLANKTIACWANCLIG